MDKENNIIKVKRSFEAPLNLVWTAWTDADILDQWWVPKPYQCFTKSLNFTENVVLLKYKLLTNYIRD